MFEADVLRHAGVDHGLLFVDTDHGFNLGHDPGQLDASTHVVVARYERDAHDWWLWNELGRPPSFHYSYSAGANAAHGELTPYLPSAPSTPSALRFEAEAEWPPLAVDHGWVQPDFVPCASNGRGLRLHPSSPSMPVALEFELPLPANRASRTVRLGWISVPGPPTQLRLSLGEAKPLNLKLDLGRDGADGGEQCGVANCGPQELGGGARTARTIRVRLEASRAGVLDYIEVAEAKTGP
jgi:hypothetical protein